MEVPAGLFLIQWTSTMSNYKKHESRRITPWTDINQKTPLQEFLDNRNTLEYETRHKKLLLSRSDEAKLLNSFEPEACRYCKSVSFIRYGKLKNGENRFFCKDCGKYFSVVTNTIFDNHKIPISEWMEFMLGVFRYQSFSSISKTLRIADTTTKYWMNKLFLLLKDYQDDIVLSGVVQLDETFYKVIRSDIQTKESGLQYRGLSRNQICIGIACDATKTFCKVAGFGKPSQKSIFETFSNHIAEGSMVIHDEEKAHAKLIVDLKLSETTFNSRLLKGLSDKDNPLDPINKRCGLLKKFLGAHSGFDRDDLDGYLNLFAFICNPPSNHFMKVEYLLSVALKTPNLLKYRDYYSN